ncbi:hypothetical protein DFA_02020 [Cavenderia fasciculata]|uniref:Uncharacterized protein n=1 Tax=Cavenderia fasciculata TaxID=261658 RepID=F4PYG9_CACFS|nr:uncharacterized protein DFA_02020 [Cavenderia fasciculata]EGG19235.1 hypothetical protein DFA_02020 [Cavenderia fasciculata]|eukprot:XP_004357506.1 hypothetical protein DFA_02020 [Cavenderia fasciculata]
MSSISESKLEVEYIADISPYSGSGLDLLGVGGSGLDLLRGVGSQKSFSENPPTDWTGDEGMGGGAILVDILAGAWTAGMAAAAAGGRATLALGGRASTTSTGCGGSISLLESREIEEGTGEVGVLPPVLGLACNLSRVDEFEEVIKTSRRSGPYYEFKGIGALDSTFIEIQKPMHSQKRTEYYSSHSWQLLVV